MGKRLVIMRIEEEDIIWLYMEIYFVVFICVYMYFKGGIVIMYVARVKS